MTDRQIIRQIRSELGSLMLLIAVTRRNMAQCGPINISIRMFDVRLLLFSSKSPRGAFLPRYEVISSRFPEIPQAHPLVI
jgi:hypothetical protein